MRAPSLAIRLAAAAAVVWMCAAPVAAGESNTPPARVRTSDARLRTMLDDGVARSATLRKLIEALQATDVIVYISPQVPARETIAGELHFAATVAGERYLNVRVQQEMPPAQLTAIIAHELQHALEVAGSPHVVDADSMRAMYRSVGYRVTYTAYETEAAKTVARRVLEEIVASRRERQPAR